MDRLTRWHKIREGTTLNRVLMALLLVQVVIFGWAWNGSGDLPDEPLVEVGERMTTLSGYHDQGDTVIDLANDQGLWHLVFAVHSRCGHCRRVMPELVDWWNNDHEFEMWMIAAEERANTVGYLDSLGVRTKLLTIWPVERGSDEVRVAGLTPNLYLFDPQGEIRYAGHGARWSKLDSVYAAERQR